MLGLRQGIWLLLASGLFWYSSRFTQWLSALQRYKYVALTGGLLLVLATLLFGRNPLGYGPRLWLQIGGVYFQPSEPLKLLLGIYLAAYLGSQPLFRRSLWPYILPTLVIQGIAAGLLVTQRDLGTASLLVGIYIIALYLANGRKRVLAIGGLLLLALGGLGYMLSELVRLRLQIWYNPWVDPQGSGYQIIQALIALANGGLFGRGPGIGYPNLVPVSYSDFIFPAIVEENGLLGAIALLGLWAIFVTEGLQIALRAANAYHRLLAGVISLWFGMQTLIIIGGSTRLLPLTGVTLPFMSYGGSSLVTTFLALLLLLQIGQQNPIPPVQDYSRFRHWKILHGILLTGFAIAALGIGWWTVVRNDDLLARSDNPRRALNARIIARGALLDRNRQPINMTCGQPGDYKRCYRYPELLPVVGYTHPVYGETGLEAALDDYLRGEQGQPASRIWWHHLLYGQPPAGIDVRLTLHADLNRLAADLFAGRAGAAVLLNAENGEVLAMVSQPSYHPADLEDVATLTARADAPLFNRATQGLYPVPSELLEPFRAASFPTNAHIQSTAFRLPVSQPRDGLESPLLLALDTAALVTGGQRPAPKIVLSVESLQGSVPIATEAETKVIEGVQNNALQAWRLQEEPVFWAFSSAVSDEQTAITWAIGGTLPDWPGTPLAAVVVLEGHAPNETRLMILQLLRAATH